MIMDCLSIAMGGTWNIITQYCHKSDMLHLIHIKWNNLWYCISFRCLKEIESFHLESYCSQKDLDSFICMRASNLFARIFLAKDEIAANSGKPNSMHIYANKKFSLGILILGNV